MVQPIPRDSIREVGLLWKAGKATEVPQAAGRIGDLGSYDSSWLSLVQVDLI